jgi:hypothetical protein
MEKELKTLLKQIIINQVAINARQIQQKSNILNKNLSSSCINEAIEDFIDVENNNSGSLQQYFDKLGL